MVVLSTLQQDCSLSEGHVCQLNMFRFTLQSALYENEDFIKRIRGTSECIVSTVGLLSQLQVSL